jgi:hypothetical protein
MLRRMREQGTSEALREDENIAAAVEYTLSSATSLPAIPVSSNEGNPTDTLPQHTVSFLQQRSEQRTEVL